MSALRISRPGHPVQLIVQEPATARVAGHGGAAMGFWSGTTLTAHERRDNAPKKHLPRQPLNRTRCSIPTRFGDPCARTPGHRGSHKSADAVARLNASRRAA